MEKHYYLNNIYDQLFYKFLAFGVYAFDLKSEYWSQYKPTKSKIVYINKKLCSWVGPSLVVSQLLYFYFNYSQHEFQTLAMMYTMIPVCMIVAISPRCSLWPHNFEKLYEGISLQSKSVIAQTSGFKTVMKNFPEIICLHSLYKKTKGENRNFLEQIIIKTEKYTRWSHVFIYSLILVCASSFLVAPMIRNFENNQSIHNITTRLEIVLHIWLPFDYEFNFYNYLAIQIIMAYATFGGITIFALFDTLNIMVIYHILGHVKYLKHLIQMLTVEQKNLNDEEIKKRLVEITCYYNEIKSMLGDIEAAFGWNILCMYLHNLIAGGIQMYQLMNAGHDTGQLLSYGLMTPLNMGELMLISLILEEFRTQGDDISTLIYNLHWTDMSISNQKIVLIILCQTQSILEFTAAFNTKTGVEPAVNIFKTTFSYYVMIKARV